MERVKQAMSDILNILGLWLIIAFVIWFCIAGCYGAGSTPVKSSPLYNTPESEVFMTFVVIPIFALCWPIYYWTYLGFKFLTKKTRKVTKAPE